MVRTSWGLALGWLVVVGCVGDTTVTGDGGTNDATTDTTSPVDSGGGDVTDSSPQTDASDAGTFDVHSLPGLALWLNGGVGLAQDGNGHVTKWADQSGNGNDATPAGPDAGTVPTVVSATNNLPAVHFAGGARLNVADSLSLHVGTADFLLEVVMRHTTQSASGILFVKQVQTSPYAGVAAFVNNPNAGHFYGQTQYGSNPEYAYTAASTLNNDVPHVFSFRREGAMIATRVDGTDDGTMAWDASTVDCTAANQPLWIGANNVYTQIFQGDVSEIVFVVGPTTNANMTATEQYLKAKYKL